MEEITKGRRPSRPNQTNLPTRQASTESHESGASNTAKEAEQGTSPLTTSFPPSSKNSPSTSLQQRNRLSDAGANLADNSSSSPFDEQKEFLEQVSRKLEMDTLGPRRGSSKAMFGVSMERNGDLGIGRRLVELDVPIGEAREEEREDVKRTPWSGRKVRRGVLVPLVVVNGM